MPVTFGDPSNFRTENLTFEVVCFDGAYHAVLGRPRYAKFMAVPNYTYLKLKMSGPKGVISVGGSFQHSYLCEVDSCEQAARIVTRKELLVIQRDLAEEVPDSNRGGGSFEPAEGVKEVQLDPVGSPSKTARISSSLDPK